MIGLPTGQATAIVVDVDRKNGVDGLDTLGELGAVILPDTPLAHTASGGLHLYFRTTGSVIRNTAGARGRGLGRGLDLRGDGGYVITPTPGTGYWWDPYFNLDTAELVTLPPWAVPRETLPSATTRPRKPARGLSPYGEAALDGAARRIISAANGEQEATINGEAFAIGSLVGAGAIPTDFARRVLIWAARQVPSYNPYRPWHQSELDAKVERALTAGMRRPRRSPHG